MMPDHAGRFSVMITPESIQESACFVFGISKEVMEGDGRKRPAPDCRRVICYLIDKYTGMKPPRIARYIGNKDRSTVFSCIESCKDLCKVNPEFAAMVVRVEQRLEGSCA